MYYVVGKVKKLVKYPKSVNRLRKAKSAYDRSLTKKVIETV